MILHPSNHMFMGLLASFPYKKCFYDVYMSVDCITTVLIQRRALNPSIRKQWWILIVNIHIPPSNCPCSAEAVTTALVYRA